jgi:L-ascorbate metabolism protein UlaG (beta-lactamase superfamily)
MVMIDRIELDFLGHSGFLLKTGEGKKVIIDPYNVSDEVAGKIGRADLVLITHSHYDHCSIKDIEKFAGNGTTIVIPADCQSKITRVEGVEMQIIEAGEDFKISGIKIEAISAYNVQKEFHPKREGWVGFIVKVGDFILYHAGDTDKIPEMKNLTGYGKHGQEFVALLPVSGKFVMDAEEASEVASLLSPDLCIPMHYGAGVAGTIEDAKRFVNLCDDLGLKAMILEKI